MSQVLALITSDAALVRCELDRVRQRFELEPGTAVGVGGWQDGQVVERRYGASAPSLEAWEAPESEVVMLATRPLSVGQSIEHSSQPFRFRQWLFAATGQLEKGQLVRQRLEAELPEFLASTLRGQTWEEVAFATFLAELREIGRIEDPSLDLSTAAMRLSACAKAIEQVAGPKAGFSLVASNGRLLVATRRGAQGLSYTLLEGQADCERHELTAKTSAAEVTVRDHRRRRSVVVASDVAPGDGWVALPDGATLAVDRKLAVTIK